MCRPSAMLGHFSRSKSARRTKQGGRAQQRRGQAALAEVAFSRYAQAALHSDAWMGHRNSGTVKWQGEW